MNRFNKGKLLGIVAASLSGVSLIGVGFATWVIGTKTTTDTGDVTIVADDVKYQSLKVSVKFEDGITLAETGAASKDSVFNYESGKTGDLTVAADFTFTVGKDYTDFANDYDRINFTFADTSKETDKDDYVDNKIVSGTAYTRNDNTANLTYFDLADSLDIGSLTFEGQDGALTKTATKSVTLTFKWGSLFGTVGKSPMNYYNETLNSLSEDKKEAYMQNAYKELKAMETKYAPSTTSSKKLKLQISLDKKSA